MKKIICVWGLARSGTSLACGILNSIGVNVVTNKPKEFQLRNNHKGMFEDLGVMHFNFVEYHNVRNLVIQNEIIPKQIIDIIKKRIMKFLERYKNIEYLGFKVLNYLMIETIIDLIPEIYVIRVVRDLESHAKSNKVFQFVNYSRDITLEKSRENIKGDFKVFNDIYNRSLSKHDRKMTINFSLMKKNSISAAELMCKFLEFDFTEEIKDNVKKFVDPNISTWKEENGVLIPVDPRLKK